MGKAKRDIKYEENIFWQSSIIFRPLKKEMTSPSRNITTQNPWVRIEFLPKKWLYILQT